MYNLNIFHLQLITARCSLILADLTCDNDGGFLSHFFTALKNFFTHVTLKSDGLNNAAAIPDLEKP